MSLGDIAMEHDKKLTANAQKLRREMTPEERKLWYMFLKRLPFTVNRQKVIGKYIVDFYCHRARVAIELDGTQHYEPEGKAYDARRDEYLHHCGITVLRYSNLEINKEFESVCSHILFIMEKTLGKKIILKD